MSYFDHGPVEILFVDDDRDDFELTRELLEEIGGGKINLEWRSSYEEGLESLRRGSHQICLLDHNLGARSGLEFLGEAVGGGCTVPIVMLTGENNRSIEQRVLAAGAADYLVKGKLDAEALWRALRHALERNRALEALRQRDRLFRAIFESTQDAIVIADDDARYVDANPAALRMFGLTLDELRQKRVFDLTQRQRSVPLWQKFVAAGVQAGEIEMDTSEGERRIVEYRASSSILPQRHLSVLRDITERKRAEETRVRLAAIVGSADDAIVAKDLDGIIREWNPGAERIFLCKAEAAIGTSVLRFVPPDKVQEWKEIYRRAANGEVVRNLETTRRRLDGQLIEVSIAVNPLKDAAGQLIGVFTITRDITETNKLRARLAIADRMASVGTLAAGVAHEINNPLAAVIANAQTCVSEIRELMMQGPLPQERVATVTAALDDILAASGRVKEIVRDLKLFSRPGEEQKVPVDVPRALETAVRMAWNEIRHRASLVKDLQPTPLIDASEGRLGQIFLNLLVNAAQAIPEGRAPENEIRICSRTEGTRAVVEISDTGCGIPADKLSRIFEPFYTTKPIGQGTGLGLSIVHGLVQSLGGDISVKSVVGAGTEFRLSFPAGTLSPETGTAAPGPVSAAPPERMRVLVVDDDLFILRAIQRTLHKHDLAAVSDARQALARLQAGEVYDLILCDLMMPDMTGMDLHEQLEKELPAMARRMVFLTGGAFTPRARQFLEEQGHRRLDKPFDPEQLQRLVAQLGP